MDLQLALFPDEHPAPAETGVGLAHPSPEIQALGARLPHSVRLGTSSWSFPGWAGAVWDRAASVATLAQDGLSAYAQHPLLRTVGLDRTFYRPMDDAEYARYAAQVPDDFRFLVKADRLLTTPSDPERPAARAGNPLFLDPVAARDRMVRPILSGLADRAGPLLFQLPPIVPRAVGGTGRFLDRLQRFLAGLPPGLSYALELRTPEFLTERYARILRDAGVAHCFSVHPAAPTLERQLEVIHPHGQPILVARWMLRPGSAYEAAKQRYEPFDRIVDPDDASRDRLAGAVLDALIAEREAFVIANNKAEGSAPLSLARLAARIVDGTLASPPSTGERRSSPLEPEPT